MQETNKNDVNSLLVRELIDEKRKTRRWKNIRFFLMFLLLSYTIFSIFKLFNGSSSTSSSLNGKYVSLIYLDGMIAPGRSFSARELVPTLREAFSDKNSLGVVIDINSPGGTPVQAAIIHDAILRFKKEYNKKVIVVGEDLLTSGAYYVAVAADKIYVNPNTLTGSIGVVLKGFGFVELMKKVGIERRVYVAGDEKDRLDPFLPQTPGDEKKISEVMGEVHQNFVRAVLTGRKGKLPANPETLFTGDFWSGETAQKLGLIDALGNLTDATNKEFNTTEFKEYGGLPNFFRVFGGQLSNTFDKLVYL